MTIALLSPNKTSYSETFIQAQKNGLKGTVFYYYDGFVPKKLEGEGSIQIPYGNIRKRLGLVFKDVVSESLYRSFKAKRIDVVLAQYGPTGQAVATICEKAGIPLVTHFHGYDASVAEVIKKHRQYQDAFRVSKKIIAVSKEMLKDLEALGCPSEKLVYNPCAPRDAFFKVAPRFTSKQFLSIGRFTDKKAPYYLILSLKEVLKTVPDAKLVMVGEGPLLNACVNLVNYLNLGASITFKGACGVDEIMHYMEDSIAFVQHSVTADNGDKEGTPVAVLEASAAGLPVVSSYHAGIQDVVKHGKTGFLVEEHDVKGFSDYMLKLIFDFDLAKRLGLSGQLLVKQSFSMDKHLSILQDTLEK